MCGTRTDSSGVQPRPHLTLFLLQSLGQSVITAMSGPCQHSSVLGPDRYVFFYSATGQLFTLTDELDPSMYVGGTLNLSHKAGESLNWNDHGLPFATVNCSYYIF